jgi:hypothetical protein
MAGRAASGSTAPAQRRGYWLTAAVLLLVMLGGTLPLPLYVLYERRMQSLGGESQLAIFPGASHLFDDPGTLEHVAQLARDWFAAHLTQVPGSASRRTGADPGRPGGCRPGQ